MAKKKQKPAQLEAEIVDSPAPVPMPEKLYPAIAANLRMSGQDLADKLRTERRTKRLAERGY